MPRLYIKLFLFVILVFLFTIAFLLNQFQAISSEEDYFDDIIALDSPPHRNKHLSILPHISTRLPHLSIFLSSDSPSQTIRSLNRAVLRVDRHRKKSATQLKQPLEPAEIYSRKPKLLPRLLKLSADKSQSQAISLKHPPLSKQTPKRSYSTTESPEHSSKHSLSGSKFNEIPPNAPNSSSSKPHKLPSKAPSAQSTFRNFSSASLQQIQFSEHVFVFSSFVDKRKGNMDYECIRVVIVKNVYRESHFQCILDYIPNDNATGTSTIKQIQIEASLYELAENHLQLFGTFLLSCCCCSSDLQASPQPNASTNAHTKWGFDLDTLHEWTLTDGDNEKRIPITYHIPPETSIESYSVEYGICVPYLFGSLYGKERLVEFFELNRLLGVERVNIYANKDSLSDELMQTIEYYTTIGLLELIEYTPPTEDIWYYGQLVTITDCLYRNIGVARYLSFHDLDEFIVPIKHDSLVELYNDIFNESIASYRIPSRLFLIENETPITVNNVKSQSRIDTHLTKCVLRPEMVFEQGIHHTSRVIQDHYKTVSMSPNDAILHHYKKDIGNTTSITNDYIERFSDRLNRTYQLTLQQIDQSN